MLFRSSGSGAALATVITLAGVCLVLPGFTVSAQGLQYSQSQLIFAALASLILSGGFVFTRRFAIANSSSRSPPTRTAE